MENKDKPAYPRSGFELSQNDSGYYYDNGLTKLEAFTMAAMQGLCANTLISESILPISAIAIATETLKQLEHGK